MRRALSLKGRCHFRRTKSTNLHTTRSVSETFFSTTPTGITSSSSTSTSSSSLFPSGVYPIVVTPFFDNDDKKESIDYDSFARSIEFFVNSKVCSGITITGVLGESNRLTDVERAQLIRVARDVIRDKNNNSNHRHHKLFHLCVGTSHTGTAATVALSQMAFELGADSVMVAPTKDMMSFSSQPSDDDIFELYRRVAEESCSCTKNNFKIVLQDHPSSTGVSMSLELISKIVMEIPAVECIKLESLPTVNRLATLDNVLQKQNNNEEDDDGVKILTGLGALYAGYDLELGVTSGFMTGFAFPEILTAMNDYARVGEYHKAHTIYRKYLPLIVLEQQPGGGLAIRKELYKLRGLIRSSHVRHPGKNISPVLQKTLHQELERTFPPGIDITKPLPVELFQV